MVAKRICLLHRPLIVPTVVEQVSQSRLTSNNSNLVWIECVREGW